VGSSGIPKHSRTGSGTRLVVPCCADIAFGAWGVGRVRGRTVEGGVVVTNRRDRIGKRDQDQCLNRRQWPPGRQKPTKDANLVSSTTGQPNELASRTKVFWTTMTKTRGHRVSHRRPLTSILTRCGRANPLDDLHPSSCAFSQVNRAKLDFDFEKVCSVSLSNINTYGCLVCGKYFQGRGRSSYAYAHSIHEDHHVFINLETTKVGYGKDRPRSPKHLDSHPRFMFSQTDTRLTTHP
jgi:hypothetical protein